MYAAISQTGDHFTMRQTCPMAESVDPSKPKFDEKFRRIISGWDDSAQLKEEQQRRENAEARDFEERRLREEGQKRRQKAEDFTDLT
ncbi:hypothetical protein EMCG_07592 [[Emmonsia] crescens]|uniref:Uncharacterized protein n=1 Tax=[Emmonsia] crescens TaxID=73230 RepID=A0A0G2I917_9EURO|nr:hypothetical protein EMCG_07592 [Emmonsia crescens UAMH 3008]